MTVPPEYFQIEVGKGKSDKGDLVGLGVTLRDAKTGIKDRYEPGM